MLTKLIIQLIYAINFSVTRLLESGEGSRGGGKIQKGCRVAVQQARQYPVTAISVTKDVSYLLVTVASSENLYLFKITDTFGTVTPFRLVLKSLCFVQSSLIVKV